MRDKNFIFVFLVCCFIFSFICESTSELFTIGYSTYLIGSALLGGGMYKWDTIKDNTYCKFSECCNADYLPYDLDRLKTSLSQRMFGQPLVTELVNILAAHKLSLQDNNKKNNKALVISLHGWSGVGKNFATTLIAEAIFKQGMESKYVKVFMGKKDFDSNNLLNSQKNLVNSIKNVVKGCSTSLIILDEVHEMGPGIIDAMKPMLDHHHAVDGVDYRDSIFIFISNVGGQEIASELMELYSHGVKRNEIEFHNFEPIIRRTAYYTGGFENSSMIAQHLIDHYIPFLPLEQQHVEACARAALREYGVFHPSDDLMADALSVITYGPSADQALFANNGCKRFTRHIPYVVQKHRIKAEL